MTDAPSTLRSRTSTAIMALRGGKPQQESPRGSPCFFRESPRKKRPVQVSAPRGVATMKPTLTESAQACMLDLTLAAMMVGLASRLCDSMALCPPLSA